MSGPLQKSRGFITGLALMMLVGISEIGITYGQSVYLGLKSYENLEKINEQLILKTKVICCIKQQLNDNTPIENLNIDGITVEVFTEPSGYLVKYIDKIWILTVENNEIVKISA